MASVQSNNLGVILLSCIHVICFAENIDFLIRYDGDVTDSTVIKLKETLLQDARRQNTSVSVESRRLMWPFRGDGEYHNNKMITELRITRCSRCELIKDEILATSIVLCVRTLFSDIVRKCTDVITENRAMESLWKTLAFMDVFIIADNTMVLDAFTTNMIRANNVLQVDMTFNDLDDLPNIRKLQLDGSITHFFVSVSPKNLASILRQFSRFGPDSNWLFDLRHDFQGHMEDALRNVLEDGDAVALVTPSGRRKRHTNQSLLEVVLQSADEETKQGSVLEVKKCYSSCGHLSNLTTIAEVTSDGEIILYDEIFPITFTGFHQRKFKVVTKEYSPFVKKHIRDGVVTYGGLCIYILDLLADTLNFTYDLYEVPDGSFGVADTDGNWSGMIGEVHKGNADFAVNGITITSGREMVVDFTFPYWEEPTAVLISHFANETKIFSLMKPLQWGVWGAAVANVLGAAVMLYMMTYLSTCVNPLPSNMLSFGACFWYCYGAFFQQGGFDCPKNSPARIIASTWWIISIIIYAVYTGNLIAFLTVTDQKMPFDSIQEMVKQSEYSYGVERGIVQHMLFKEAKSGIYHDIWRGIDADDDNIVSSLAEGVNKTASEMFAFIGEKAALKAAIAGRCDISFVEEEFFKSGFGFAMRDRWPYTKYFNQVIMRLIEAGYIENWRRRDWPRDTCTWKGKSLQAEPISLDGVSGSFILLAFGLVLAAIALCYEHIDHHWWPHFTLTSLADQIMPNKNSVILLWRPVTTTVTSPPEVEETVPPLVDELNNSIVEAPVTNVEVKNRDLQTFHRNVAFRRVRRTKKVMNTSRTKYELNDINVSTVETS